MENDFLRGYKMSRLAAALSCLHNVLAFQGHPEKVERFHLNIINKSRSPKRAFSIKSETTRNA